MKLAITPQWINTKLGHAGIDANVTDVHLELVDENPFSKKWKLHLQHTANHDIVPKTLFLKWSHLSREATFYQIVKNVDHRLPIVPCYFTQIADQDNYILLLDVSETHESRPPAQLPPYEHECEQIIDGLADIHAYWWNHPHLETTFATIPEEAAIRNNIAENAEHYKEFAEFLKDRLMSWQREIYEAIIAALPELLVARYATQSHFTLVFEDVHIGNFLYPKRDGDPLYFIDWEQWGVDLAMNDLAYMMAMFWSQERRNYLEYRYLERYFRRIKTNGVTTFTWDDLQYDYRLCIMRHLLTVVWQWKHGNLTDVWWNHLQRLTSAYIDLNCSDLIR